MDNDHLYDEWKKRRREIEVPQEFSDHVMTRLFVESNHCPGPQSHSARETLVRWVLSIGLGATGLLRLTYVTYNLLVP